MDMLSHCININTREKKSCMQICHNNINMDENEQSRVIIVINIID